MRVSVSIQIIPRPMGRLGLGSGMGDSASFQIIPYPVDRLGLWSESCVVGRLGSGPRVAVGLSLRGYFR